MAYATYSDLEAMWKPLSTAQQATATTLLDYAGNIIDTCATIDTTNAKQMSIAKYVSCSMVRRSMQAQDSELFGVNQASATMGPFNQQATFANPTGDLYLSASEKAMLGANGSFITSLRPVINPTLGGCHANA